MHHTADSILLYPDRARVFRLFLRYLCVFVVCVGLIVFRDLGRGLNGLLFFLLIAITFVSGYSCFAVLYRIAVPKPSLIIDQEGLTDYCSCIVTGYGLIRWHEIASIATTTYGRAPIFNFAFDQFLVITPQNYGAILERQSVVSKALRLPVPLFMRMPSGISIPEVMLPTAVGSVMTDVNRQYQQWRHQHLAQFRHLPEHLNSMLRN